VANQKQEAAGESHSFLPWQVLGFAVTLPASAKCAKLLGQNRHVFTFLYPILICRVTD